MTIQKENPKEDRFWIMNTVLPLVLTVALYTVLNSATLFGNLVTGLFGPEAPVLFGKPLFSEGIFRAVCLYGRDFLWGYALMFAMIFMFHDNRDQFRHGAGIVFGFEIVLELFKLFSITSRGLSIGSMAGVFLGNITVLLIVMIRKEWLV